MIQTYIINLKTSVDRRDYMEKIMAPFSYLDIVYIDAVNGKEMSQEEVDSAFDQKTAFKMYGRELRRGEIGCTLSHKRCAQMLIESAKDYALILEDDLIWQCGQFEPLFSKIGDTLNTEKATILLLSGDYWYTSLKGFIGDYKLAKVRDAVCTQSYFINRAAAQKLIELGNWHVADDWWAIRSTGIEILALYPHIADQNRADVKTVIAEVYGGLKRENLSLSRRCILKWLSLVKKVLVWTHHFEAKNFKWE